MNIIMIMAGGIGSRFGAVIPKQYNLISGQPVIDYVIDVVAAVQKCDKVVVVIDKQWIEYSEKLKNSGFDFVENGETRLQSVKNGLDFIKQNYTCQKLILVDSVAPFIYPELLDDYFNKLDEYAAVITAQKITGGFTDVNNTPLDRDQYIITQSPEGFQFELFYQHFDLHADYQEMACMLPKDAKRHYFFDFKNNLKITYDFELKYAEFMLNSLHGGHSNKRAAFFDRSILLTAGLKSYLLRNEHEKTMQWINEVYNVIPALFNEWGITSFLPNQVSRFGLVIDAKSSIHGDVILKFIPPFIKRYERELESLTLLSKEFMCELLDHKDENHVLLLKKIPKAKYASFNDNILLTNFFKKVVNTAIEHKPDLAIKHIPHYYEELKEKLLSLEEIPYMRSQVENELLYAVNLYKTEFGNAPKYILHGDLHNYNILNDGNSFYGIDPCGLIAPLEFECVRFIRNEVREHPEFGFEERFDLLIHNFSRFFNASKIVNAFIIDMAFCTYNSTFENATNEETLIDLELIEIAKQWHHRLKTFLKSRPPA